MFIQNFKQMFNTYTTQTHITFTLTDVYIYLCIYILYSGSCSTVDRVLYQIWCSCYLQLSNTCPAFCTVIIIITVNVWNRFSVELVSLGIFIFWMKYTFGAHFLCEIFSVRFGNIWFVFDLAVCLVRSWAGWLARFGSLRMTLAVGWF